MIELQDNVATGDGDLGVHVVRPDGPGPFPVVISFHHGPGLDDGSKQAMARIAEWGYYVISHDRYHRAQPWLVIDRSTASKEEQERFFEIFVGTTDEMVAADVHAVLGYLEDDPAARAAPMGCIGYCIGARSVLRALANDPARFRAGVALHPSRCTTEEPDSPHLAVPGYDGWLYVGFGADDTVQPPADNAALIEATNALAHGEAEVHDGANHGFAVPGGTFHEAAAERSYARARAMFAEALGDEASPGSEPERRGGR
jgi:carboxymethylenebutenolidase